MPMHDWTRVDANLFHHFHVGLLAAFGRTLNQGLLPREYYARVDQTAPPVVPDVLTLYRPDDSPKPRRSRPSGNLSLATLDPPRVQHRATADSKVRIKPAERRVAIRHNSDDQIVAVIEVVSQSNKSAEGIAKFADKALELMRDGVHFFFLDCFPPTRRDPEGLHAYLWNKLVGVKHDGPVTTPSLASYSAHAGGRFTSYVQPAPVGRKLSTMPLFLTSDHYINLPLEVIYQQSWDCLGQADQDLLNK